MLDKEYKTKISIESQQAYEDISLFIEKISFEQDKYKYGSIYFLDSSRRSVVRTNSKKKIVELTDKVEEWVFDSINELNKKDVKDGK